MSASQIMTSELVCSENANKGNLSKKEEPLQGELLDESSVVGLESDFLVYKDNSLIWGRFNLGKVEQKLLNALISRLNPINTSHKNMVWSLNKRDLADLGISSRDNLLREIDNITTNLQKEVVRIPKKDENGRIREDGSFEKINIFYNSSWDNTSEIATFQFHEQIIPYLLDLKGHFTKYHLFHIKDMGSVYGIRLYELLRSMFSMDTVRSGRFKSSININYENLRDAFSIGKKYPRFSSFKERVLHPALRDINTTDIEVTYTLPDRKTPNSVKPVRTITFHVQARVGYHPTELLDGELVPIEDPNTIRISVRRQLQQFFTAKDSETLISKYGTVRCLNNMQLLNNEGALKGIKNISAWLKKAISSDYAGGPEAKIRTILKIDQETDEHKKRFLEEQILPVWSEISDKNKTELIEHGLNKGSIALDYAQYLCLCLQGQVPDKKVSRKEEKDAVAREMMNINSNDW